jgi:hypothetical protein
LRELALFDPADAFATEFESYVDPSTRANGLKPGDQFANLLQLPAIDCFIEKGPTRVKGRVDAMNEPYRANAVLLVGLVNELRRTEEPTNRLAARSSASC